MDPRYRCAGSPWYLFQCPSGRSILANLKRWHPISQTIDGWTWWTRVEATWGYVLPVNACNAKEHWKEGTSLFPWRMDSYSFLFFPTRLLAMCRGDTGKSLSCRLKDRYVVDLLSVSKIFLECMHECQALPAFILSLCQSECDCGSFQVLTVLTCNSSLVSKQYSWEISSVVICIYLHLFAV